MLTEDIFASNAQHQPFVIVESNNGQGSNSYSVVVAHLVCCFFILLMNNFRFMVQSPFRVEFYTDFVLECLNIVLDRFSEKKN